MNKLLIGEILILSILFIVWSIIYVKRQEKLEKSEKESTIDSGIDNNIYDSLLVKGSVRFAENRIVSNSKLEKIRESLDKEKFF